MVRVMTRVDAWALVGAKDPIRPSRDPSVAVVEPAGHRLGNDRTASVGLVSSSLR